MKLTVLYVVCSYAMALTSTTKWIAQCTFYVIFVLLVFYIFYIILVQQMHLIKVNFNNVLKLFLAYIFLIYFCNCYQSMSNRQFEQLHTDELSLLASLEKYISAENKKLKTVTRSKYLKPFYITWYCSCLLFKFNT